MKGKPWLPYVGLAALFIGLTFSLGVYQAFTAPIAVPVEVFSIQSPSQGEQTSGVVLNPSESSISRSLPLLNPYPELEGVIVYVNTASSEEWEQLPGIGPSKAAAIVAYVTEKGPLTNLDQLLEVKGIGEKTLENIRPFLQLEDLG